MTIDSVAAPARQGAPPGGYVPVGSYRLNPGLIRTLPEQFVRERKILPLALGRDDLLVAMASPEDARAVAALRRLARCEVRPVRSSSAEIEVGLAQALSPEAAPDVWPALLRTCVETGLLTRRQAAELERGRSEPSTSDPVDEFGGGILQGSDRVEALSLTLFLPRLRLDDWSINHAFASLLPREIAERWQVVPVLATRDRMVVATPVLPPLRALNEISDATGFPLRLVLCAPDELRRGLERAYSGSSRPKPTDKSVPALLLQQGKVTAEQAASANTVGEKTGETVEQVLLRLGYVSEQQLLETQALVHDTQLVRLREQQIDLSLVAAIPEAVARRHRVIPLKKLRFAVEVAMVDLDATDARDLLESLLGQPVRAVLCGEADMAEALARVYAASRRVPRSAETLLGEYLVRGGRLTVGQIAQGLRQQQRSGQLLGRCLVELGLLDEPALAEVLGLQQGIPWVTASHFSPPRETLETLPKEVAERLVVLPIHREGRLLTVASAEPRDTEMVRQVCEQTELDVRVVVAEPGSILAAIDRLYVAKLSEVSAEVREFGDVLVRRGLLTREQLHQAMRHHMEDGVPFDEALTDLRLIPDDSLAAALAAYLKVPRLDLRYRSISTEVVDGLGTRREVQRWVEPVEAYVARLLPEKVGREVGAIPISREGDTIVVAFANPVDEATRRAVAERLGTSISIVVSTRSQVMEAWGRMSGRLSLGELLVTSNVISRRELEDALALQKQAGVRLGKALISLGHVSQEELVSVLAEQNSVPFYNLTGIEIPEEIVRSVPEELERTHGLVPLDRDGDTLTVAMINPMDLQAVDEVESITGCRVEAVMTTEEDLDEALEKVYRDDYFQHAANDLVTRRSDDSAIKVLIMRQKIGLAIFLAVSLVLIFLNALAYFMVAVAASTIFYITFSTYKFYLIFKALSHTLEVDVTEEEVAQLNERDLPVYTILVPLYREAEVLPTLVRSIDDLDYPKAKLDVKLLLEEDDKETIEAVSRHGLPAHFKMVVVPNGQPKGKPKACNYGLIHATGELVVIFDAEDIPDLDQLKKVVVGFRKADPRVQCIQCKLNYYNRDQNLLTRWFTTEYSMWFDLFIPGLDASNAPIPLGGTSNHFRTNVLRELGAWDPYNVTEDADLGIRLFKAGYKTAVVDSTTYEEANSELYNWIRQRSRWVKGYIQTYLVHMRHPVKLIRDIGPYQFFSFTMVVGGTFFGFLLNPVYWLLTALWYLTHWSAIQFLFPGPVFYLGAFGMYVGNFAFMYTNVAGCLRRGYYDMVKYALISPLYWALMSVGAWKGFIQLLYRPSYWEKTKHGLFQGEIKTRPVANVGDLL